MDSDDDDDKGDDGWSFWRSLTSKLETPILAMLICVVLALLLLQLPLLYCSLLVGNFRRKHPVLPMNGRMPY